MYHYKLVIDKKPKIKVSRSTTIKFPESVPGAVVVVLSNVVDVVAVTGVIGEVVGILHISEMNYVNQTSKEVL